VLISGDHLLGRISLYYDYGWSPDPVGEFLRSLDLVQALDGRLCVAGHGRPFTDVGAHIEANRKLVHERLGAVTAALDAEPRTVVEIVPEIYGEPLTELNAGWRLSETLCYLRHLEVEGRLSRERAEARGGGGEAAAPEGLSRERAEARGGGGEAAAPEGLSRERAEAPGGGGEAAAPERWRRA
jgi:glyoxylase-like metal-dependent hydrolase (beta-lactamase superfamily II)